MYALLVLLEEKGTSSTLPGEIFFFQLNACMKIRSFFQAFPYPL